ncbi:hypothetical protein AB0903_08290 [Streptomyces sp. NPDC048389]|uniref:hypothetical protein n=1 Tax=Streptomyces sp. NPDC048389 TaxID=3154622 RepID=UPI0034513B15
MNLLRDTPPATLEQMHKLSDRSDKLLLSDLERAELLIDIPAALRESPEISASFLPCSEEWKEVHSKLPPFPVDEHGEDLSVWTTGVPFGDFTLLIPDDAVEVPTLQLFTKVGNLWGRLILKGPVAQGRITVRQASVEFTLHCPSVACGTDSKCRAWCKDCKCQSIVLNGFDCSICWCPVHNDQ